MRIAAHNNKVESNFQPSQSVAFGIGDVSVVIDILRNKLYEYKIRTLVQEYMSNARDAHREVGQTKPIKVTAPTQFDPTFRVRDFGPGVSPDRIENQALYGRDNEYSDEEEFDFEDSEHESDISPEDREEILRFSAEFSDRYSGDALVTRISEETWISKQDIETVLSEEGSL